VEGLNIQCENVNTAVATAMSRCIVHGSCESTATAKLETKGSRRSEKLLKKWG